MARYKWASAFDWLDDKAYGWDAATLRQELIGLALQVGNDEIQDRYQREMDDDGFFQDLDITNKLTGQQCIALLVEAGEDERELIDGEITIEQMRLKVQGYIESGDISYDEVEAMIP